MNPDGLCPLDLLARIDSHPGKRILDRLFAYGSTAKLLSGNALEARQLVLLLEDPRDPLRIGPTDQRGKLQGLFEEVFRLFHNFLASVKTLIDHTRNLMDADFIQECHRAEYQQRVNATFAHDQLAQFMQGFRNYVLHRSIPVLELAHFIVPDPARLELNVGVTPEMLNWSNWSPGARAFLDAHQPKIRLLGLIDDYDRKARDFHEAFVQLFHQHHHEEIEAAVALISEWNRGVVA